MRSSYAGALRADIRRRDAQESGTNHPNVKVVISVIANPLPSIGLSKNADDTVLSDRANSKLSPGDAMNELPSSCNQVLRAARGSPGPFYCVETRRQR